MEAGINYFLEAGSGTRKLLAGSFSLGLTLLICAGVCSARRLNDWLAERLNADPSGLSCFHHMSIAVWRQQQPLDHSHVGTGSYHSHVSSLPASG